MSGPAVLEDGFIIEGEEAWLPEEWAAEQARRARVLDKHRRYNAKRPGRVDARAALRRHISPSLGGLAGEPVTG